MEDSLNHELWNRVAARVIALAFVTAGLAACGEKLSDVHSGGPSANPVSPSAQVVGTAPAEPQGNTPQTTAVAAAPSDKRPEGEGGPKEGDNHSYNTVAPTTPQKADGKNHTSSPERSQ